MPTSSPADKLPRSNRTPTQRRAVPRAEPHRCYNLAHRFREARGIGSAALKASTIWSERMKTYWTYIMSNKSRRLYTGYTGDMPLRVCEHENKLYPDTFTARYEFDMLVWCESFASPISARI